MSQKERPLNSTWGKGDSPKVHYCAPGHSIICREQGDGVTRGPVSYTEITHRPLSLQAVLREKGMAAVDRAQLTQPVREREQVS